MTPEARQRLKDRTAHYTSLLHRKVLAPQHEAMLLMGATASQQKTTEDIVIEFTAMEQAVCGVVANMLSGLAATICQNHPAKTQAKAGEVVNRVSVMIADGLNRMATGVDAEDLHVTAFNNGQVKPFDFRNHLSGATK